MALFTGLALLSNIPLSPDSAHSAWAWGGKKKEEQKQEEQKQADSAKTEDTEADAPKEPAKVEAVDPAQEARDLYEHGLELFRIGQLQAEKGNANGQKSLLKESLKQFEKAIKVEEARLAEDGEETDPAEATPKTNGKVDVRVEAQSNIGFVYLTLRDYKPAIKAFERALQLNPQHLNTLNGLATTYALDNRVEDAILTFDKLTTLDPGNPQFFFNKGSVLQKAGRVEDAKPAYEEAIRLDPNDQRSLFNLATLYENLGQPEDALPLYIKAKSIAIDTPIGLEALHRIESIRAQEKANRQGSREVDREKVETQKTSQMVNDLQFWKKKAKKE